MTTARIENHKQIQKEKGNEYSQASRARKLEADPEAYRIHNNEVHREWVHANHKHVRDWYKKIMLKRDVFFGTLQMIRQKI